MRTSLEERKKWSLSKLRYEQKYSEEARGMYRLGHKGLFCSFSTSKMFWIPQHRLKNNTSISMSSRIMKWAPVSNKSFGHLNNYLFSPTFCPSHDIIALRNNNAHIKNCKLDFNVFFWLVATFLTANGYFTQGVSNTCCQEASGYFPYNYFIYLIMNREILAACSINTFSISSSSCQIKSK